MYKDKEKQRRNRSTCNSDTKAAGLKAWKANNAEKMREYRRKNHLKDPQKQRARMAISNEIVHGRMLPANQKACHYCGKQAHHHHHYNGYSEEHKLDVIPVCVQCHAAIEKQRA